MSRDARFAELDQLIANEPPPINGRGRPRSTSHRDPEKPAPETPAIPCQPEKHESTKPSVQPAIVIYGRMHAASKHVAEQLRHLPSAEHDYHGTLLTMLSAVQALDRDIRMLLKMRDEKGEL